MYSIKDKDIELGVVGWVGSVKC